MYYPDLTCYRDGILGGLANVYPAIKNIGWLDKNKTYTKGIVEINLRQKLKDLLFLDIQNSEDAKMGIFNEKKAIIIHTMRVRGSPYKCILCELPSLVTMVPEESLRYTGKLQFTAGQSEVCIPSIKPGEFYSFPTMLYHYIDEHSYKPPQEFLDAVERFDLKKPYNIDDEQRNLVVIQMPWDKVDGYLP